MLRPCGPGFCRLGFLRFGPTAQNVGSVFFRFGQINGAVDSVRFVVGSVKKFNNGEKLTFMSHKPKDVKKMLERLKQCLYLN